MCLLGPLNVVQFNKQISLYSKVQKPSAQVCKCASTCTSACESVQVLCASTQVLAQVRKCARNCTNTQVYNSVQVRKCLRKCVSVQVLAQVCKCVVCKCASTCTSTQLRSTQVHKCASTQVREYASVQVLVQASA